MHEARGPELCRDDPVRQSLRIAVLLQCNWDESATVAICRAGLPPSPCACSPRLFGEVPGPRRRRLRQGKLPFPGRLRATEGPDAFAAWLRPLYAKGGSVYAKRFGAPIRSSIPGPLHPPVAISNSRICQRSLRRQVRSVTKTHVLRLRIRRR